MPAALVAILLSGAAYVPVDWDDPASRAETVFGEAAVACVMGEGMAITPDGLVWTVTDNDGVDDASGETFLWSVPLGKQTAWN